MFVFFLDHKSNMTSITKHKLETGQISFATTEQFERIFFWSFPWATFYAMCVFYVDRNWHVATSSREL